MEASDSLAVPGVSTTAYEPYCVGHAVTTARGVRQKMSFDNRCLLTQVETGDVDSGDPLEILNMREQQVREYDELGRLVKLSQTRPTGTNPVVTDLDIYGGSAEERTFEYDEMDRLLKITFEDSSEMSWEYDLEGQVTKLTDPEGQVTEYTYFRDGLLKEVILKRPPAADRIFTYSYDIVGRLLAISYPSGTNIVAKFDDGTNTPGSGWDEKGQLRHLRYEKSGNLVRRFEYTYDDSGNRASQLDVTSTKAIKWEYLYDWFDRLEIVRRGEAANVGALPSPLPTVSIYTYDASDNRIEFQVPQDDLTFTYVLDDADNLVSVTRQEASDPPVLVETFTYDEDGNMTTRTDVLASEVITYGWDDFNKLVKVSSADGSGPTTTVKADHRYDGNGIRKRKLDKAGDSSAEFTSGISTLSSKAAAISSSSPTISYIQGHHILGAEVNGNFQYFLTDALGSVRDVLDGSGNVVQSYEFNEHGIPMDGSGASSGTFSPKTYQGALSVNDDRNDSGLYLMGHRHYAPDLGRFISRDPIGFQGGLNLFNGAATNPVTYVDPSGLQCQKDPKLSKKYPELPGAIGAIMGLKGKPCSGGGYHFSASEVNSILGEVRGVLADSSFKIYAADKASGGGHSYAERVEGAIKVYNKTGDLMTNPGLSGNVSRTDVLSHVLLHELLHEVVNRHKKGADCPGPDPELELQTAEELKANHNFVISLLDCLLPGTRGLSQKPNMPMPGGGPV